MTDYEHLRPAIGEWTDTGSDGRVEWTCSSSEPGKMTCTTCGHIITTLAPGETIQSADPRISEHRCASPGDAEVGYMVFVRVRGNEVPNYGAFREWLRELCDTIGAKLDGADEPGEPWAVGDVHGGWCTDKWGGKYFDSHAYANVWQHIESGIASRAMGYVWAAIHLIQPLEEAGYKIEGVEVMRDGELVILA